MSSCCLVVKEAEEDGQRCSQIKEANNLLLSCEENRRRETPCCLVLKEPEDERQLAVKEVKEDRQCCSPMKEVE